MDVDDVLRVGIFLKILNLRFSYWNMLSKMKKWFFSISDKKAKHMKLQMNSFLWTIEQVLKTLFSLSTEFSLYFEMKQNKKVLV